MTGNIDETHAEFSRHWKVSEAEVDGDAAAFFLLEAVGVDAGQRANQGGLAMVDMSGRTGDNILHAPAPHATTRFGVARPAAGPAEGRGNPDFPRRRRTGQSGYPGVRPQRQRYF